MGRPIRDDVRSAAHEIWAEAGRRSEALVVDRAQAADLMEDSAARVSRYLDHIEAPKSSPKNGLLLLSSPNCCEISRHEVPEALRR